jgi:hypothetical protein
MVRKKVSDAESARADLGPRKGKPAWREGRHALPFHELGDDEFEVFCFLLLLKEHPTDDLYYYGKTGDGGRDIVHKKNGKTYLIQCKRYGRKVGPPEIAQELAKLCANVFQNSIPDRPDEIQFYVVPDVTADAADLIREQSIWRRESSKALKKHMKKDPSQELLEFAHTWWPSPGYVAAISLTERAKKWPELLEEFFGVRKVISGSIEDLRNIVLKELPPVLKDVFTPSPPQPTSEGATNPPLQEAIDGSVVETAFGHASHLLLSWPTTVGNDRWLDRTELSQIAAAITSESSSTTLLLGAPGSGKSALLAKLARQCSEAGQAVLAIKADTLDIGVDSLGKLSEELHLPALLTDCVGAHAASDKVIVLIDQLDALADLVDLHSGRLNVLLNVIKQLSEQPNVHVVCSCRVFEHGHDIRLTSIKAEVVHLALPTWEQVTEVLRDRQIEAGHWPGEFRELLRTPQHLKVFFQRLQGTAEDRVFTTYQQLLEDLWARCITNSDGLPGRSQLVMEMAEVMAGREVLWLPTVQFEYRGTLITDLQAKGILTGSANGLSIGFQHQTLLEHARARAFARGEGSLASYVQDRQDGLFVRPILWSSLHFLRGADTDAYQCEMEALWKEPLRKHVRHLLIDFLGQVSYPPPSEAEQRWLIDYLLKPDFRPKVLAAIRGSAAWFTILAPSHFPPLMQLPEAEAWSMVAVLSAAWREHRTECLRLLQGHWLPEKSKDPLTWSTLEQLTEWDREAIDMAECIIKRNEVTPSAVMVVASRVAESVPDLAVELVATKLYSDLNKMEAEPDPAPPEPPPGADEAARVAQRVTFRPRERFERLLQGSQNWYDLPTLAEAAPGAFVEQVWPWFVRVVDHLVRNRESRVDSFRTDWSLATELRSEEEDERMYPVVGAVEVALNTLAKQDPDAFHSLLEREKRRDALVVQRLFCRALLQIAGSRPLEGLQFLTDDPRRLVLGSIKDEHAESRALIAGLVPHLTDPQAKILEDAILGWNRYRDDLEEEPGGRFRMQRWERQHRLRMLTAFPLGRLSPESQALVRGEQVALPGYEEAGVHSTRGGWIGSPMSAEQMARARDDHIVRLFEILEDAVDHHPKDMLRGGSREASQEFGRFAKSHPQRALIILGRFLPGKQERPAAHALDAFSGNDDLRETLFSLVLDLDRRGFRSEDFRVHAARALGNSAKDETGLPDAVCALLERWLAEPWKVTEAARGEAREQKEERPHGILWQRGGALILPFGTYYLLHALTYGYLLRKPPAADRWLQMLEAHVERTESPDTWSALCEELQYLRLCDPGRSVAFLQRLFEKYPGVRDSQHGVRLLAHALSFLPGGTTQCFLQAIRDGDWKDGPQAFGELLALRALRYPEDQWTIEEAGRALKDSVRVRSCCGALRLVHGFLSWLGFSRFNETSGGATADSQKVQQVRVGMAFTAAELWQNPRCREGATDMLVGLIPLADAWISHAIMHVFLATDTLYADEVTRRFLKMLLAHPDVLRASQDIFLVERLEDILSAEPELVLNFCRELVRIRASELTSMRTGFAANTAHLTNIALTLQRVGEGYRSKGLELFEMLLDLGVQDAQATLQELDKRPRGIPQPVRSPLRRRRRKP